jgi:hypothetical protein
MITYFNEADLVSFGAYLLSEERQSRISEVNKNNVTDADIQNWRDQSFNSRPVDSIIQQVCEEYSQRGKVGLEKYGVTLDRVDLTKEQWIQHAKEEAMDLTLYLTKIQKLL